MAEGGHDSAPPVNKDNTHDTSDDQKGSALGFIECLEVIAEWKVYINPTIQKPLTLRSLSHLEMLGERGRWSSGENSQD